MPDVERSTYHSHDPMNTKYKKHDDVGGDTAKSCNNKEPRAAGLVLHPLQFKGMIANSVAKLTDGGEVLSNCPAKTGALRLREHG